MRGLENKLRLVESRIRTSAGFEGVGTKGKNVGGEAGLKEHCFIGRDSGRRGLR